MKNNMTWNEFEKKYGKIDLNKIKAARCTEKPPIYSFDKSRNSITIELVLIPTPQETESDNGDHLIEDLDAILNDTFHVPDEE